MTTIQKKYNKLVGQYIKIHDTVFLIMGVVWREGFWSRRKFWHYELLNQKSGKKITTYICHRNYRSFKSGLLTPQEVEAWHMEIL